MLPRRSVVVIWLSVAVFATAVGATAAVLIGSTKQRALAATEASALQQLGGAEATLNRTLIGVDGMLAALPALLQSSVDAEGRLDRARAQRKIAAAAGQNLAVRDVSLIDERGAPLAGLLPRAAGSPIELPAGLLDEALRREPATLSIGVPVIDFVSGEPTVHVARRVELAPGRSAVALAAMPVPMLATLLSPVGEVQGLQITLERHDGTLLASTPTMDARLGRRLPELQPGALMGGHTEALPARLGGGTARVVARPLSYPGLRVVVSAPLATALADWREQRDVFAAVAAAFVLLLVGSGAVIHRQMNRLYAARAATARAQGTLERAMASMADGFMLWDPQDRLLAWNQRYVDLFPWLEPVLRPGVSFEAVVDVAARALFPDGSMSEQRDVWREMRISQHRSTNGQYEVELANGQVINVIERRTPDGGVVGLVRDVTRFERELGRAKVAAEAANEAKSRFLATMSHEMRTPLNGVLGINALLLRTPLNDQQRAYAGTIETCGHALLALIDDILDLSRIEAGRLELTDVPFDPVRLCEEAVESLRARALEKSLRLSLRVPRDAPRSLRGDENRLRQVVFNLLGNALKFTESGSVDVTLAWRELDDPRVELDLRVRDTGIGIAADVLPRLFERFSQADQSTARRFGGSGLGLAISREIVQAMGGRIEVDSREGVGSEFRVVLELPRSAAPAAADTRPLGLSGAGRTLRILVAEDNDVNQLVIGAMLAQMGHDCEIVRDGRAALERARQGGWDCILMDIQMPGMDGEAATRAIRALGGPASRVPIVAITANAMTDDQRSHRAAGMNEHLSKPIQPERLAQVLSRIGVPA
jgi:signal transduction histidine kinase